MGGEQSKAEPGPTKDASPKGGGTPKTSSLRKSKYSQKEEIIMVLHKYRMHMRPDNIIGEGSSSICRKATDIETGKEVAVKLYKGSGKADHDDVTLKKFRRQIAVLQELHEPFTMPKHPELWCDQLAKSTPSRLFLTLLDYSKDGQGRPGHDPEDGSMYVVTELAQYNLKDYFACLRDQGKKLSQEQVRQMAQAIVLVVAGLHAKGFVHLDLKPENLMVFEGRIKLIDLDGCLKAGDQVSIEDSSVSFSPCYCAPEFARFLIDSDVGILTVNPALDVWSIAITLSELVALDPILKPTFASFLRNGRSQRQASFLFLEWLGYSRKAPLTKKVEAFNPEFTDLLAKWLLVPDIAMRKSLAQTLASHPYLVPGGRAKQEGEDSGTPSRGVSTPNLEEGQQVQTQVRRRAADTTHQAPLLQGSLYKLDANGSPKNPVQWRKRDMWIAHNGSLCYWSMKEEKRLVIIDGAQLQGAQIRPLTDSVRDHAFQVVVDNECHETVFNFAAETQEEMATWKSQLRLDTVHKTMRLGGRMKEELDKFRLTVKNRRKVVSDMDADQHTPVFKAKLWKLKAEGDKSKAADWYEREMWVGKHGSLVYWSKKEERELVYYTVEDIQRASFTETKDDQNCMEFPFQIQISGTEDVEFLPGEFAANSDEDRKRWIAELRKFNSA